MAKSADLMRREALAALIGIGATLAAGVASAQGPAPAPSAPKPAAPPAAAKPAVPAVLPAKPAVPAAHVHADAAPAAALSAQHKALIEATSACVRAGRVCLARCTDHLASGSTMMAECQRAVMNMLAVVEAMGQVAGFANADAKKQVAKACASFRKTCAAACEPHAAHHEECKACMDACTACAKACEAFAA
jgi:Cys-rich four helix bundle protein (predicted Tat secretion target)